MRHFHYDPPQTPFLRELYCDDYLSLIDKPSGLLSVSGNQICYFDSAHSRVMQKYQWAEPVHRLDMATSGIILFALSKNAERDLKRQFRERQVEKEYEAIVWGVMGKVGDSGEICYPLICDWEKRPKQKICYSRGKKSLTFYRIIEVLPDNKTRVVLTPVTGRSHQLRLHLMACGFPIVGDRLYAHPNARMASKRLLLHARALRFTHPITGKKMAIESQSPF